MFSQAVLLFPHLLLLCCKVCASGRSRWQKNSCQWMYSCSLRVGWLFRLVYDVSLRVGEYCNRCNFFVRDGIVVLGFIFISGGGFLHEIDLSWEWRVRLLHFSFQLVFKSAQNCISSKSSYEVNKTRTSSNHHLWNPSSCRKYWPFNLVKLTQA